MSGDPNTSDENGASHTGDSGLFDSLFGGSSTLGVDDLAALPEKLLLSDVEGSLETLGRLRAFDVGTDFFQSAPPSVVLTDDSRQALLQSLTISTDAGFRAVGRMAGSETLWIHSTTAAFRHVDQLLESLGGAADNVLATVHVTVVGNAFAGNLSIVCPVDIAKRWVEPLTGETVQEFGSFEQSAFGEIGNICGAHFVTHLSESLGIQSMISPPVVLLRSPENALALALAEYPDLTEGIVLPLHSTEDAPDSPHGIFVILPDPFTLGTFLKALEKGKSD